MLEIVQKFLKLMKFSTKILSFLQAGCPSRRPANSVKALKAHHRRKLG